MWLFKAPTPAGARKKMLAQEELALLQYEKEFDFYNVAVRTTRERVSRLKAQVAQDEADRQEAIARSKAAMIPPRPPTRPMPPETN